MTKITNSLRQSRRAKPVFWLVLLLTAGIYLGYGSFLDHPFIFDDNLFITENPFVKMGVSSQSLGWAYRNSSRISWHPITWISLILDFEFYGLEPFGYHFTNLILHILNSLLVFFVLRRMSKLFWASALVSAIFAFHPVNVETVLWASQRKTLLCGLFWMLSMWAYIRYIEAPSIDKYIFIGVFFTLGLMSKLLIFSFPLAMLLLDYWPLARFRNETKNSWSRLTIFKVGTNHFLQLVLEKVPFLLLGGIVVFILVFFDLNKEGAVPGAPPFGLRMTNAVVSYVIYICKFLWPARLVVWDSFPSHVSLLRVLISLILLGIGTLVAIMNAARRPYFLVGWLWFLCVLAPAIGFFQGSIWPAQANHHLYLAIIGLLIVVVWGILDLNVYSRLKSFLVFFFAGVLCGAIFVARYQARYWTNEVTLYRHMLQNTKDNYFGHFIMGETLFKKGALAEALSHLEQSQSLNPCFVNVYHELENQLVTQGQNDKAGQFWYKYLDCVPDKCFGHNRVGAALVRLGRPREGIYHLEKSLRLNPDYAPAHKNLGSALSVLKKYREAIFHLQKALRLDSEMHDAHNNLGVTLYNIGEYQNAGLHFREAIRIKPDYVEALYCLGLVEGRMGDVKKAIEHFQKTLSFEADHIQAHYQMGRALLTQRRFTEAAICFRAVLRRQPDHAHARNALSVAMANMEFD